MLEDMSKLENLSLKPVRTRPTGFFKKVYKPP